MTVGMACGFVWKVGLSSCILACSYACRWMLIAFYVMRCSIQSWHWNEKRFIAQYYADLSKKEIKEANARQAELQAKFKALEEELLA